MKTFRLALVLGLPLLILQLALDVADGASPYHRAVGLACLACGLAGALLVFHILDELFGTAVAFWTSVLLLFATFLLFYLGPEPNATTGVTFFAAALVLALWWPARRALGDGRAVMLGVLVGLCTTLRTANGLLLLLPVATLLVDGRVEARRAARTGGLMLAAFALGALPQILTLGTTLDPDLLANAAHEWILFDLGHPALLSTLFSSRHGLLFWTPVLWGGFLGFIWLWRRDRFATLALGAPVVLMTYLNSCSGPWWLGEGFSNRHFDSVLPFLALGLGATLARVKEGVNRRPLRVVWAAGLAFVLWNQLLVVQYREQTIPDDDTVSFATVAENSARLFVRYAGTPLAWPANWIFAAAHDLPAAGFDLMVGQQLFLGENTLGGDLPAGDGRVASLFAGDWSAPAPCGAATCREVRGRARVLAPLGAPEDLDLKVSALGRGTLALTVNGTEVASFPLTPELQGLRVRVSKQNWQRGLNDVGVSVGVGGAAMVESLVFERVEPSRPSRGGGPF